MPRTRTPSAGSRIPDQGTPALREQVADFTNAVTRLAQELAMLREVLDSVRDDFSRALTNDRFRSPLPITHVTSVPADALAEDFGDRINRFPPQDLPCAEAPDTPAPELREQRGLFAD